MPSVTPRLSEVPTVEIRAEAFDSFWGDTRDDVFTLAKLLARTSSCSVLAPPSAHRNDASVSSQRPPPLTGGMDRGELERYRTSRRSRSYNRMYATVR